MNFTCFHLCNTCFHWKFNDLCNLAIILTRISSVGEVHPVDVTCPLQVHIPPGVEHACIAGMGAAVVIDDCCFVAIDSPFWSPAITNTYLMSWSTQGNILCLLCDQIILHIELYHWVFKTDMILSCLLWCCFIT